MPKIVLTEIQYNNDYNCHVIVFVHKKYSITDCKHYYVFSVLRFVMFLY
jgi:hypothetical protein